MTDFSQIEALARRVSEFENASVIQVSFLPGGITNRNFRLDVDAQAFVLRMPGENSALLGIDREREVINNRVAAQAGIAPEVISVIMPEGYLVTRFIEGVKLTAETLRSREGLSRVSETLRAIHNGPPFRGEFSPFRAVSGYASNLPSWEMVFSRDIGLANRLAAEIEQKMYSGEPLPQRPIHADLLNENLLDDGNRIRVLDWEYSGMGDPFFDLGNLADHHDLDEEQEGKLLTAYLGAWTKRDHARIKLMRIMSAAREAMWGVMQRSASRLDFDFEGYARRFFNRMMSMASDDRYPRWLELAAVSETRANGTYLGVI